MHGPNMALADLAASPSLLPATAFDRYGSLPRKPPGNRSTMKLKSRDGLSLARSGCPFPGHLSGVNVPGLPL